ncbi:hypothetical protein OG204_21635 [Streptomyces sp. NBC_01387]|nr:MULTISPECIES: hypothetical protein [unclassified Streptomyces]MCX4549074.1 hypothetical protein [Streptomyces sp. NBC_01500]WSC20651.1 hypothetical protein OIE60_13675 [Streptomyces sp. NBC_01766]WSV54680.1 hypothetical protein OG282_13725 [Streptomyces sp. NBC_01014]
MFNRFRHGCHGLSNRWGLDLVDGLALGVVAASVTTVVALITHL